MKLTSQQLKQIIREEINSVLQGSTGHLASLAKRDDEEDIELDEKKDEKTPEEAEKAK